MNNNQQQQRIQQNMLAGPSSGLTRYRSAPSSYFASLLDTAGNDAVFGGDDLQHLFNTQASSPDTQRILSRFMSGTDTVRENSSNANARLSSQFPPPEKTEPRQPPHQPLQRQPSNDYPSSSQAMYPQPGSSCGSMENSYSRLISSQFPPQAKAEPCQPPHQPLERQVSSDYSSDSQAMMYRGQNPDSGSSGGAAENSYCGFLGPYGGNQLKMESTAGGNPGLVRHSSSPAGFFASIDIENEFSTMRAMGSFGGGNNNSSNNANAEASSSSTSRFKHQMDLSSKYSSSGMMSTIPEIDLKGVRENSVENRHFSQDHGNSVNFMTGLPMGSWDDSDSFLQGQTDKEIKRFSSANALDDQNNEGGNRPATRLSHQLSLPTSSAELSAMEKMLLETVPCKMRAKRGFATHPRSIAERVRRNKISERIRKVQELVPNTEKQTNTSDILDMAVDYIKDLQRQVKMLSDNRARCSCSGIQNL